MVTEDGTHEEKVGLVGRKWDWSAVGWTYKEKVGLVGRY